VPRGIDSTAPSERIRASGAATEGLTGLGVPVALRDGSRARMRPWRPSDGPSLVSGFYRLSPTSSYRRFLSASPVLTPQMFHDLTDVNHRDHEAIVAFDERGSEGLGIARYLRDPERPHVAEVALAVVDYWQNRGLGTILLEAISERARAEGIRRFTALMLAENRRMRHLLDRLGPVRIINRACGTVNSRCRSRRSDCRFASDGLKSMAGERWNQTPNARSAPSST
jgi:RimJ/RimL family protein N-acetyltransferase